ncbi:MAG: CCA tRNA nucleotidyltransferase [Planctomycetota bacterium]
MAQGATKEDALAVVRTLREAGFEALLAGGCVRDMLLGLHPTDYDVATNATPEQVAGLFKRVLMVGAKFGVAMVVRRRRTVEVATFRDDLSYADGRRPTGVRFSSPREDARRRDFTINGMFYDPIADEVIDYVGGQDDLRRGIIRAIGDPDRRMGEDYLRLLRAVRFAARFDFTIEPATREAIERHAPHLAQISGERIHDEMTKMLAGPNALAAMAEVHCLGLAEPIFGPSVAGQASWQAGMQRLERLADQRDPTLALACLLADADARTIRRLCRHWGTPNELRDGLVHLASNLPRWKTAADLPLPAFKRLMASQTWNRLCKLWRAEERRLTGGESQSRAIARRVEGIDPARIAPPPLVTGDDLKQLGLTEGPLLGRVLRTLYDEQLDEQLTTREQAMARAATLVRETTRA